MLDDVVDVKNISPLLNRLLSVLQQPTFATVVHAFYSLHDVSTATSTFFIMFSRVCCRGNGLLATQRSTILSRVTACFSTDAASTGRLLQLNDLNNIAEATKKVRGLVMYES